MGELRNKLQRHTRDKDMVERVLAELLERSLLSDTQFARAYTRELLEYRHASSREVRLKLMKRYISSDTIDDILKDITPDALESNALYEGEKILQALNHKQLTKEQLREKFMQRLTRKGFPYAMAKAVFSSLRVADEDE